MADDQDKLLIDEQETVQIKDLNKVTTVNNTDLLLLDDGAASSNAITFKNFLKTVNHQTFKGEELGYFKEIIKSTIATELAADNDFIKSIYDLIVDKLIENESSKLANLFTKIKSRLTDSISSATLSRSDDLLIMSSSTIQKTPVPKQLLGVPSNLEYGGITSSDTLYSSDYENKVISINMKDNDDVTLIFYKSYDNSPVYLDIEIQVKINDNRMQKKSLNLQYSDETTYNWVYEIAGPRGLFTRIPIYKGWYIQKRAYRYGDPVPDLLKL
ncbi:DUF685 domain-containing protein [Borreliella burgdorferi]|uniref:Uncharacterized protein n=5 Tax=Borreliella burgdorferi TaxID=139 RepID=A0A0H3C333_BORBZ|nr:DUF685 domain-containing protein [Borreliella burgdorferi]ACK75257.1 conserved hypothetical protein [Borreliella burgdorferi ZS7]ACN23972.1 conserved hypothetical protein [Borreliella burgdorferi 64b]ACO38053.1 conserved hypothetical protein [Borreliella burgdorferi Bol26]PRR34574.1 DUF685 domain-containing protein [Borreliella burgdorferi]